MGNRAASSRGNVRYVTGRRRGITRRRCGAGFSYHDPSGELIGDGAVRQRILSLAIPPAWERVWICPRANGHLQAYGFDDRGRKQYIYHPLYRAMRDIAKFERLADFALALPRIRRKVRRHLALKGLPREKVLAAMVRLLDNTYVRVGNARYEKQNKSFGLTTMRSRHLVIERNSISLSFRGKGGKEQTVEIKDQRLARILKRCDELPGRRLFRYRQDGELQNVDSEDVNHYLAEIAGDGFTAKDFRTWGGTVSAAEHLLRLGPAETETQLKKNVADAYKHVAAVLGNTAAVCRKYYVHPAVILAYEKGSLEQKMKFGPSNKGLRTMERATLGLIQSASQQALRERIRDVEAA